MRKKILFISHLANRTGAPIALCHTIRAIKSQCDMDCDIIIMNNGELKSEFEKYGRVFQGWNKKNIFHKIGRRLGIKGAKFNYLNVAKARRYDLVYANTAVSLPIALHIKEVLNIPFVLHLHESSYLLSKTGVSQDDLLKCERIITVSQFAADALVNNYNYPQEKIIISHPFSELAISLLNSNDLCTKKRGNRTFNIGLAGSGYWIKSIDRLPMLMDIFFRKYPNINCRFVWVGEMMGEEEERLFFELKKFGLEDKVKLVGKVDNPEVYFKRFDVFLLMSREDSFPLVAIENAAICNPILCFDDCSGAVEWVKKGAGDVIPYMQLDILADSIYKYYSDDEYRIQIGRKARKIVQNIYTDNEKNIQSIASFLFSNE